MKKIKILKGRKKYSVQYVEDDVAQEYADSNYAEIIGDRTTKHRCGYMLDNDRGPCRLWGTGEDGRCRHHG